MKINKNILILSAVLIIAMAVSGLFNQVKAQDKESPPPLVSFEGQLMWKEPGMVIVSERKMAVNQFTVYLDEVGDDISLETLPVPCRAKITFPDPRQAGSLVISEIRVIKRADNPDKQYGLEKP